jgi:hypothetical protein
MLEIGDNLATVLRQLVFGLTFGAFALCWYLLERHRAKIDAERWEREHHDAWHADDHQRDPSTDP